MFMSIQASHPAFEPSRDAHRARVAEHMAALKELSDLAVELAKALGRQAIVAAQAGEEAAREAEKSFSRATRTVRLTAALDVRLSESLLAKDEDGEGGGDESCAPPYELAGAAQRLRKALAPWIVPEPAAPGETGAETGGEREREARERLVETEGDGGSLDAAWRNVGRGIPSPLAGEGGPRSGSDGGCDAVEARSIAAAEAEGQFGPGCLTPHPSAPPTPSPARGEGKLERGP